MKRASFAVLTALFALAIRIQPVIAQATSQGIESSESSFNLVISDCESSIIAEIPLRHDRFDHVFVHSFHLTPVIERFKVIMGPNEKPIMHLFELEYESTGVGMPSDAEDGYRLVDGKFILNMSREFAVIPLMVSIVEGHGLIIDDCFYPFTNWVPRETQLFLAAKAVF